MPNYNEIFMTQFIQTLAQLSAGVVTAVFAVPAYSYYVKGNLFFSTNEYNEEYEISDINKEKSSNINHDDRSTNEDNVEDENEETEQDDEL
jgi:sortase (surface protein transpeptidase)